MKRLIIKITITLLLAVLLFYLMLPPLNISSPSFWIYMLFNIIIYVFISAGTSLNFRNVKVVENQIHGLSFSKEAKYCFGAMAIVFILILVINIAISPLFNAKSYRTRISIEEGKIFEEDVKEVDFTKIPLLDKASSRKLGDRVMGEMPDLVSQFYVSDLYTQINYNGKIVRATPLEYDDIIKYFTNRNEGVKGYITVDSVNGESTIKRLDKGMKYMPSAYFFENLDRKLRFSYPTLIFGNESFELDDEGNPYWIVPIIKYKGVGLREEITGVVTLDPITGKTKKYDVGNIPEWIDHVYSSELIIEQLNDWGLYTNGFFNSIFGQKNVTMTTEGYNYIILNDDVYLYTGITSVSSDESNLGFILCNMRTKETTYYLVPGAEEYSAMASAEGQVQQMNYVSTFPLLVNMDGRPTYLVSLKDNAGLVKMYGFVDVQDYQRVVVTESSKGIEEAAKNYLESGKPNTDTSKNVTVSITVKTVVSAEIDGNTHYYITDNNNNNNNKYRASIKVNENLLPFISAGDKVKITYNRETDVTEIIKIEK